MKNVMAKLALVLMTTGAPLAAVAETYGQIGIRIGDAQNLLVTVSDDGFWIEYPSAWPIRVSVGEFVGTSIGIFSNSWCESKRQIIENHQVLYAPGERRPRAGGFEMNFVVSVGPGELDEKDTLKHLVAKAKAAGYPKVPARILNPVRIQDVSLGFAAKDSAMVHLEGLGPLEKFFEKKADQASVSTRGLVEVYRVPAVDLACDLMQGEVILTATVDATVYPVEVRRSGTLTSSQLRTIHEGLLRASETSNEQSLRFGTDVSDEQKRLILTAARLEHEIDQAYRSGSKAFGPGNFAAVFEAFFSKTERGVKRSVESIAYEKLSREVSIQEVVSQKPRAFRYSSVAQPVSAARQ